MLTRRELQARYAGSAAGLVWAYAQPLLTLLVYLLVFDVVFGMRVPVGQEAPTRLGLFLVAGLLPWMLFAECLNRAAASLHEAGGLLQKNALPPALFPARSVLASALVYLPLLALLPLVYGVWGVGPALSWLALPVMLGLQVLLVLALGRALAVMVLAMRDIQHGLGFFLSVGLFASPALFPITLFPHGLQGLLFINPMTPFILGYQAILLQGQWPTLQVWLSALVWCALGVALAWRLWRNSRDLLADWL